MNLCGLQLLILALEAEVAILGKDRLEVKFKGQIGVYACVVN